MTTNQVGEAVLLLDPAALSRASSLDEVGLARFYWAVSIGSDPSLPAAIAFAAGDRLAVIAPGTQDASLADISITFKGTRT
jgi:hypothetical protein